MRIRARLCSVLITSWALCSSCVNGQSPPPVPGGDQPLDQERIRRKEALAQLVKLTEDQLAVRMKSHAQGIVSTNELEQARVELAKARADQAQFEGKLAAVRDQINVIIEIRERQLERVLKLERSSAASSYEVGAARRRLAHARYRLLELENKGEAVFEMREIVKIRERELEYFSDSRGSSPGEIALARYRLAYSRYKMAQLEGRSKDALREVYITVEVQEAMLRRMTSLLASGAASGLEVEFSRYHAELARERLAVLQGKPEEAREHIRLTVEALENVCRRLESDRPGAPTMKAYCAAENSWHRTRLAMAKDLKELPDKDTWEEFED